MYKRNNIFLLILALPFIKVLGEEFDYTNLVQSQRKKQTSVSKLYQKAIGDYRQGIINNSLQKGTSQKNDEDIRLRPMTNEERLFIGIAKIVDLTFEELEKEDTGGLVLEAQEEKDIESPLSQKAYEELRFLNANGRGFLYSLKPVTHAGRATMLRYVVDPNITKGNIEAKQLLQKEFMGNSDFKSAMASYILKSSKFEKKIVDAFLCTKNSQYDPTNIVDSINLIKEYAEIINGMHLLIKDKKFENEKILFLKHLDIYSNDLFKKFLLILEEYYKEKSSWAQISYPKAKALENFLKNGKLFTQVLFPAMTACGVCDLFLTTTTLFAPGGQNSQYNYAKVVLSNVPSIKALNIAHPNFQKPIPVNFEFSRTNELVGVVTTGQNGSGKSFGFKQILANLAFAQAYGLVRGEFEFTPFHAIDVHANISDSDDASKYTNEVDSFKNLVDRIKKLPKDKKSVVLFDEAFVSTGSREAFELLATTARFLKQNQNALAFYVTHSQELAHIPELEPWRTKVEKNIDGTYTSLYTLEKGVSQENNAYFAMYRAVGPVFKQLLDKHYAKKDSDLGDTVSSKDTNTNQSVNTPVPA